MKIPLLLIAIALLLVSCRTQNLLSDSQNNNKQVDTSFRYQPGYQYTIRKNDKIAVSVWGQEELSVGSVYGIYNSNEVYGKWLMVDANGNIELPKIGTMPVYGKTVPQLKDTLHKIIQKWILNPVVDIKVLNKEITMLGEVRTPGVIKIDKDQNSLLEILAHAGGPEFYANLKEVKVFRQEGANVRMTTLNLSKNKDYLSANIILKPGDVVVVPSRKFKAFDKRISVIIPFATTMSAAAILFKLF